MSVQKMILWDRFKLSLHNRQEDILHERAHLSSNWAVRRTPESVSPLSPQLRVLEKNHGLPDSGRLPDWISGILTF